MVGSGGDGATSVCYAGPRQGTMGDIEATTHRSTQIHPLIDTISATGKDISPPGGELQYSLKSRPLHFSGTFVNIKNLVKLHSFYHTNVYDKLVIL